MKSEEYDELLARIRHARRGVDMALDHLQGKQEYLNALLKQLDQEESRIAHEALYPEHAASRKLVIHE